jgi:hypothetical protein
MATQRNPDSTPIWRKSSLSGADGGCVEVATSELSVLVRDSRDQTGAVLRFELAQWRGFVSQVRRGQADLG